MAWVFPWWLMSRKKGKCERTKERVSESFLELLGFFCDKRGCRGGGGEFGGREIAEESNGDRGVHYGERHKKLEFLHLCWALNFELDSIKPTAFNLQISSLFF